MDDLCKHCDLDVRTLAMQLAIKYGPEAEDLSTVAWAMYFFLTQDISKAQAMSPGYPAGNVVPIKPEGAA